MTTIQLETYVKEQFNMELYEFVKQKVEKENLYDYELADILKVNGSFIGKLRNSFGVKRSAKFSRRFEQTYGAGAVERFKKIIENPNNTLVDVAANFKFSREYARQAYEKIYGYPYTEAFQNKLQLRKRKILANRKKSKHLDLLIKLKEKMESLGLNLHLKIQKHSYAILTNGYKLLVRHALTTVTIGKKQYFHITTGAGPADIDFIICLCRNNGESIHYVIPRHVMPKYGVYLLPEAGLGESKYARFKEAWHLLNHKNPDKGGIMRAKHTKQPFEKTIFSASKYSNRSGVPPGYINAGSRLDYGNSLKARLRAEIDLAIKGDHP